MVAIVAGNGLGLFNTSNNTLGSAGMLGQGLLGQAGNLVYVNAANGDLVLQSLDESLSGRGSDLNQLRTYNSLGQLSDGLGTGWIMDGESTVVFTGAAGTVPGSSGSVNRTSGDGHVTTYTWNSSAGMYVSSEGGGALDTLQYVAATDATGKPIHQWVWTNGSTREQDVYSDSTNVGSAGAAITPVIGVLQSRKDINGDVIGFTHDSSGRLTSITDFGTGTTAGQKIELVYGTVALSNGTTATRVIQLNTYSLTMDANSRATSTVGTALQQVTYTYDGMGRLQSVTTDLTPLDTTDSAKPNTLYTTSYTYWTTTSLIASITQSDGTTASFTYDGSNRVLTATTGSGAQAVTQTFNYVNPTTTTVTTGGLTWTFKYDAATLQLKEIDAPSTSGTPLATQFQYTGSNLTEVIDPNGNAVLYGYDANDNRILERDSFGNTITRTFDADDQVLTETHYINPDPNGLDPNSTGTLTGGLTEHFVYDSQERLRFTISAEGRVIENRYDSSVYGLLTNTIAYTANRYSGTTFGLQDLTNWAAALTDKSQEELTQYTYDLRGNLASRTTFASTDSTTGVGDPSTATVTQYIYDGYGQLLQTIALRGGTPTILTSFAYDGLGRQISQTNANVTQTTYYDDADRQIQTTNAGSHLLSVKTFDTAGRLVSVNQSDVTPPDPTTGVTPPHAPARKTEYLYDALGRLQVTQTIAGVDATGKEIIGSQQFDFYDAAGRLQYTVDAGGDVIGNVYNNDGQLTTQTSYATPVVTTGWVTGTLGTDAHGNAITVYTLNKTALTVGATGTDILTNVNDRVTGYTYDSAGRLSTETVGAGTSNATTTTTLYDGLSRVISKTTGARVTRYFYDGDGNQVGVVDPLGYLTENKFDAAGRLVETVHYTTRSPAETDVSAPVWIGVTAQTVTLGQLFSYRMSAVDADGDTVIYTLQPGAPAWLSLDTSGAGGAVLKGTPPSTFTTASVVVTASDQRGKTTNVTVTLTAADTPPTWSDIPDTTVGVNTSYSLALPLATDNESTGAQLTYTITGGLPPGLTFNGSSTAPAITGTVAIAGTYNITARVTDPQGQFIEKTFAIRVTNQGPSWVPDLSTLPPAVRTQPYTYTVPAAVDPEGQALTYQIISGPSWLSIDPNTHVISGTPPAATTRLDPMPVMLQATDPSGAVVRTSFTIKGINGAPTWPNSLVYSTPAGQPIDYTPPPATDPDGDVLTYSLVSSTPSGLNLTLSVNPTTGRITSTTNVSDVRDYTIVVRATDPGGLHVDNTITVHLTDTPPVYLGGIASNYNGMARNPITAMIPLSVFSDINGPVTLSVPGATPGLMPFNGNNTDPWTPGLFFEPNYIGIPPIIHGAADVPVDPGTRPCAVLDYYSTTSAPGQVIPITIVATDAQGESVSYSFTLTFVIPPPPAPPPPLPPPPPPHPPGGPPIQPFAVGPISGLPQPTAPITPAPQPVLVMAPAPAPAPAIAPAPKPALTAAAAIAPTVDVLSAWRPTDTTGLQTYQYYDGEGRVVGSVDDKGFLTETVYNDAANTQQTLRYQAPVTPGATDTLNSLRPLAGAFETSTITYDSFGRVSTETGFDGTVTRFEYDSAGRLARQTTDDGQSDARATRTLYDVFGDVTGTVSGVGEATLSTTSTQAQVNAAIATYGMQYQYDSLGRRVKSTDANGHSTLYFYDIDNRLTHTVDAAGDVTETLYNAFGQVQSTRRYITSLTSAQLAPLSGGSNSALTPLLVTNSSDEATSYVYDQRGLVTTTNRALAGFVTTDTYDIYGQLATQTNMIVRGNNGAAGITTTTQFDYDLDGRLVSQTADVGGLNSNTQTIYDAYGRVIGSIDATGARTTTNYLNSGRTVQVIDPLGRTTSDDYDELGRVHTHTDANGKVTTYSYDNTKRTTTVTTPEGVQVKTTRDAFGETLSVIDGDGNTTTYTYDKDGHVKTVTDPLGEVTTNIYDASGRLTQTTDARGTVTKLGYDAVNRVLTRQVDPTGLNLTTTYFYDAFSRVFKVVAGTVTTSYKYDTEDRLTGIITDSSGPLKLSTAYTYDGLGDMTRVDQGNTTSTQQTTQYVYDHLGRRIKEIDASSLVPGAGSSNSTDLTTQYRYDAAGRVTRTIDASGQSTWYVYDQDGELNFTINALGEVSESDYDSDGRVVQTRQYATRLSAATLASFGDSATGFTPPAVSADDAHSYFVYDGDGRQRFIVQAVTGGSGGTWAVSEKRYDANGNVIETLDYDKFLSTATVTADDTSASPGLSVSEVDAGLTALGYQDTGLGSASTVDSTLTSVARTHFAYDADNRLRFTVNAVGDVSENVYDAGGNIVTSVRYAGVPALTAYTESAISGAVDRTNPGNQVTQFAYDTAGRLVYTVQVLAVDTTGKATKQLISKLTYDVNGHVVLSRAYATVFGSLADYSMATLNAAVTAPSVVTNPQNRTTAYAYDTAGRRVYTVQVLAVDSTGAATQQLVSKTTYDSLSHVVQTTQYASVLGALTDYTSATLDTAVAAPTVVSNPQNRTTAFVYDADGRQIYSIKVLAVDANGNATQQLVTRYNYDAMGRLVQTVGYAKVAALANYSPATIESAVDAYATPQDRITSFVYDAAGREIYSVQAAGVDATTGKPTQRITQMTYDAMGRLVRSTLYATPFTLTDYQRATLDATVAASAVVTNPLNRTTAYVYNAASEQVYNVQVLAVDGTGKPTQQIVSQNSFDALGHVVKTTAYNAYFALADYQKATLDTAVGAAAVAKDPLNRITGFVYDAAGQQVYSVRVLSVGSTGAPTAAAVARKTYDAFGQVIQNTAYASTLALADYQKQTLDAAVAVTAVASNPLNRTSAAVYDTLGRQVYSVQVSAVNGSGTPTQEIVSSNVYDAFGDVIQSTAYATQMALTDYKQATLDAAVAAHTSAQDRTSRLVYDNVGRLRFTMGADGSLSETVYDALGQVTETRQFGTFFTFDPTKNYLDSDLATLRGSAAVGDGVTRGEKYTYDEAGRLINTMDAGNYNQSSTYDGVGNRLTSTDKNGNTWTYTYDALGNMLTQLSPSMSSVRLSNGSTPKNGQLTTAFSYDVFGDVTTQTDAAGTVDARVTAFTYDNLGRQATVTQPGWYNPATGTVVNVSSTSTPPAGSFQRSVASVYDAFGDLVSTKTTTGVNTYIYGYQSFDALGRKVYDVDALNNVTGYTYDSFGDQLAVTRYSVALPATPGSTNTQYWVPSDVATRVSGDTQSRTITTTYDLLGRKLTVTQPASSNYYGGSTAATTNAATIAATSPPLTATTSYQYDAFGDLAHESQQLSATTSRDIWHYYNVMGEETVTVDAGNFQTVRTYDAVGNLETITEYAKAGAAGTLAGPPALVSTDPNDRITIYGYDARNLQTSVQRANLTYTNSADQDVSTGYGSAIPVSAATYDGDGHVLTQTDALGNVTATQYNALGQVTQVTEALRAISLPQTAVPNQVNSLTGAVDPFLNQVQVTPVTTYTLNAFGQVIQQTRNAITTNGVVIGTPTTTHASYDFAGNLISMTDANGNVTNLQVDYAGRVIKKTQATSVTLGNWQTVTQTLETRSVYDALGRQTDTLTVYTDASGVLQQTGEHQAYNAFGEVSTDSREWGLASTAPSGLSTAIVATYAYDQEGHVITKTAGDGITRYYYDLAGRLTRQEQHALTLNPDGTVKVNGDGTVTANDTVPVRITEMGYDALDHLVIERLPSYSANLAGAGAGSDTLVTPILQQTFDRWGNITQSTQGGYILNGNVAAGLQSGQSRTIKYAYNADNRVISETMPVVTAERADGTSYQAIVTHESHYDLLGRLLVERDVADDASTSAVEATQLRVRKHEYNSAGELTADVDATNVRTEYAYDVNGNRVGTRNVGNGTATDAIVNTVFVDTFDANGNLTSHGVLMQGDGTTAYVSGSGAAPVLLVTDFYQYDQANRRVISESVTHNAFLQVYSTYTRYDERGLVMAQRIPNLTFVAGQGTVDTGMVTSYGYDQFGDRTLQLDANLNGQSWNFSIGNFNAGQMTSSSVGTAYNTAGHTFGAVNRTTTYAYTGFGQVASETYTGEQLSTTGTNNRLYTYYENGLLHQVADSSSVVNGSATMNSSDASVYDYSVNADQSAVTSSTNGQTTRVMTMTYDAMDRLSDVRATAPVAGYSSISDLIYHYDELGDRREIDANYLRPGDTGSESSQRWYDYDAEGRMTIVDGTLTNGVINAAILGATQVTYDALGRRYTTNKYVGGDSSDNQAPSSEFHEIASWTEYDAQKYDYNALGYMTQIWQGITRRDSTVTTIPPSVGGPTKQGTVTHPADHTGTWYLLENRVVDVHGTVSVDTTYAPITASPLDYDVDFPGTSSTVVTYGFRADGQLSSEYTQQLNSSGQTVMQSQLNNTYDEAGVLQSYNYLQGANLSSPDFTNTYTYTYNMEFGGYKESTETVTTTGVSGAQPGTTTDTYDAHGNLITQFISNATQFTIRSLTYDNNGQIISNNQTVQNYNSVSQVVGAQDYFYVLGHQVAVLGTGSLDTAQFNNDFTPVAGAAASAPGTYAVSAGDTLASIAQAEYGDAQFWYIIADANNVAFGPNTTLPTTEVGRTYRIPTVNTEHNNSTNYAPYNPGAIIGSSSPSPYLPPPPGPSCAQQTEGIVLTAVVVAVAVAASAYTAGALSFMGPVLAGAISGAVGSTASQLTAMGLGVQQGFSGDQVFDAGLGGFVGGFASAAEGGLAAAGGSDSAFTSLGNGAGQFSNAYANIAQGAVLNQVSSLLEGNSPTVNSIENSLLSSGARAGTTALLGGSQPGLSWSSLFAGVAASAAPAANSSSAQPFSWANLASQALNGAISVAVAAAVSPRQTPGTTRDLASEAIQGQDVQLSTASISDSYAQNRGGWNLALSTAAEQDFYTPDAVSSADAAAPSAMYSSQSGFNAQAFADAISGKSSSFDSGLTSDQEARLTQRLGISTSQLYDLLQSGNYHVYTVAPTDRSSEDVGQNATGDRGNGEYVADFNRTSGLLLQQGQPLLVPNEIDPQDALNSRLTNYPKQQAVIDAANAKAAADAAAKQAGQAYLDNLMTPDGARAMHLAVDGIDSDALVSYRPGLAAEWQQEAELKDYDDKTAAYNTLVQQEHAAWNAYIGAAKLTAQIKDEPLEFILNESQKSTYDKIDEGVANALNEPFARLSDMVMGPHESMYYPGNYVYYSQYGQSLQMDYEQNLGFTWKSYQAIATNLVSAAASLTPASYANYALAGNLSISIGGTISDGIDNGFSVQGLASLGAGLLKTGVTSVGLQQFGNLNLSLPSLPEASPGVVITRPLNVTSGETFTPTYLNSPDPAVTSGSSVVVDPTYQSIASVLSPSPQLLLTETSSAAADPLPTHLDPNWVNILPSGTEAIPQPPISDPRFASSDPLVQKVATIIDTQYPGLVAGVGSPLLRANGTLASDADITLQNGIVEVKSGFGAGGLVQQQLNQEASSGLPVVAYTPVLRGGAFRQFSADGAYLTMDMNLLLDVIKP